MIVATLDETAGLTGSSANLRRARRPRKAKSSTAVVVRRGSQSHHTPHVGLAQIAPWQQRRKPKTTPVSIEPSIRASHLNSLLKRKTTAQTKAMVSASSANHAVGTCTYMIRCVLPRNCSGGATNNRQEEPIDRRT